MEGVDNIENRRDVLKDLINFKGDLSLLEKELTKFEWDSDEELVVLKLTHLENVLNRYLSDEIPKNEVCDWANTIEMREDIGINPEMENAIKELLFELANPEITYELTAQRASDLLRTSNGNP